jgi:L-alanine-DL-glutamate epimerase-like enolase superfamily enzyme
MASAKPVVRLRAGIERCPLIKPYDLSFATLTSYDSVWVSALDQDQRLGLGEAVPLPGYNWETLDSIEATIKALVAEGDGKPSTEIVEHCRAIRAGHPFAASAVMAALDLPGYLGHAQSGKRFALSASVAGEWPIEELRQAVETGLAAGFSYFKMKVGRYLDRDVEAARCILNGWPGQRYGVVFDANQAYSTAAAIEFARELQACDNRHLQWFEQPVDRQDWDGMENVCRARLAPVVLDECIYDEADIARAKRIGAHGIKLKLFKNFGINETLALARHARELGLVVVFGNGVATDIGNIGEYLTLSAGGDLFAAPAECGGFARLRKPLLGPLLSIDGKGQMTFNGDGAALPSRLADFCVQTAA